MNARKRRPRPPAPKSRAAPIPEADRRAVYDVLTASGPDVERTAGFRCYTSAWVELPTILRTVEEVNQVQYVAYLEVGDRPAAEAFLETLRAAGHATGQPEVWWWGKPAWCQPGA